jgi:hypothetical protein
MTLLLLAILTTTATAADPDRVRLDAAFEACDLMRHTVYRNSARAAADHEPSGAYGPVNRAYDRNGRGPWYIEEQRRGEDAILAGLAQNDPDAIGRGLMIFDWGFRQQSPDSSFACPDAFHSTSFFVESTAHACLLLSHSTFGPRYRDRIEAMTPKIHAAALWLADPRNARVGQARNKPYTHRRYLLAAALGESGLLCRDTRLVEASKAYVREGVALQSPEGFNPEKAGPDTSYHAVGLVFAMRYDTLVADPETRALLRPMIRRGVQWLATRIRADGSIDPSGNTRTGLGQEKGRSGIPKTLNTGAAYRAFEYWWRVEGDPSYHDLARRVADFEARSRRPSQPARAGPRRGTGNGDGTGNRDAARDRKPGRSSY